MKNWKVGLICGSLWMAARVGLACDSYAVFIAARAEGHTAHDVSISLVEQFTRFSTAQEDGAEVPNVTAQYLNSSTTQAVLGYQATERFGLQLNVPWIYREFRRPENFSFDPGNGTLVEGTRIEHGTEKGLGDVSLAGNLRLYRLNREEFHLTWNFMSGVKFPTGNTGRLSEELREVTVEGAPPGGIHGHDLTLGSGSFDGMTGTGIAARWKRWFFEASVQYAIRTEGDYNYTFANELRWSGGPGGHLLLEHEYDVALQAHISGESKGRDSFQGVQAVDTGLTAVYAGPKITVTVGDRLVAEIGLDLPVVMDNTAFQLVPDYRVRAGATWRF